MDENENKVVDTQQTNTQSEQAVDNVTVSTSANAQISVKDTAESVDNVLDDVANEDNQATDTQSTKTQTDTQEEAPKGEQTSEQQLTTAHNALDSVEKDLVSKGVDFAGLENEYMNNGGLSQQSYETLEKAGYPKAVVDGMLAGWEAASTRFVNDVYALAGGQEEFARIQQFVSSQNQDVINAFNATLDSENLMQIRMALEGIKGQMVKQYGTQRPSIVGNAAPSVDRSGYESTDEMIKDMSDPRYQKDAKFTREVYRKVKYSKLF